MARSVRRSTRRNSRSKVVRRTRVVRRSSRKVTKKCGTKKSSRTKNCGSKKARRPRRRRSLRGGFVRQHSVQQFMTGARK